MLRSGWLIFSGLALMLTTFESNAQSFYAIRRERSLIVSGGTGVATYMGELANPGDYLDAKLNLVGGLKYRVSQRIAVRTELTWFQLRGSDDLADDVSRIKRNLSFSSNNFEVNLTGQISLFQKGKFFYQRPPFNVYGFGGIGMLYFNPTTKYQGTKYALQPLKTEGVSYSRLVLAIPFGAGVRFRISPAIDVVVEGGYRKLFTDYLDDVSTTHPGPAAFSDPIAAALSDRRPEIGLPLAEAGSKRGNPEREDSYWLLNAKVEYYLPTNFGSRRKGSSRSKAGRR